MVGCFARGEAAAGARVAALLPALCNGENWCAWTVTIALARGGDGPNGWLAPGSPLAAGLAACLVSGHPHAVANGLVALALMADGTSPRAFQPLRASTLRASSEPIMKAYRGSPHVRISS